VDVGVHQDGLVHVSELANRFIKEPSEFVKVGQIVKVTVLTVDAKAKRIGLSMKQAAGSAAPAPPKAKTEPKKQSIEDQMSALNSKFRVR
jgi:uncharacterized protein